MVPITNLTALPSDISNKSLQMNQADDVLVVCFWATNSPQSDTMMNSIRDLKKDNTKKWAKVRFTSICLDYATKEGVKLCISTGAWDFDNYVCLNKEKSGQVRNDLGIPAREELPYVILVDGSGIISYKGVPA